MRSTGLAIVLITSRIWAFDWYKYRWPWMTLNGEMTLILHYFTEFVYDVVVKQLLVLHRFQNILLIVYDHIHTICPLIQHYLGKTNLGLMICEAHRWLVALHRLPLTLSYSRNLELSLMGVGSGLYMYDVVVKRWRSLSHLLMSSCNNVCVMGHCCLIEINEMKWKVTRFSNYCVTFIDVSPSYLQFEDDVTGVIVCDWLRCTELHRAGGLQSPNTIY